MALVEFTDLLPEVLAVLPSAPDPVIVRAIRNAARELCEDTRCYRHQIENETVLASQAEFEFFLPDDTVLVAPMEITVDGYPVLPTSVQMLNEDDPEWRTQTATHPTHYIRSADDLDTIRFYPIPDTTYTTVGLRGQVAIKPSRSATSVSDVFLDRYETVLVDGALGRLFMQEGAPWYNPNQAGYHAASFESGKDRARGYADGDDLPKRRTVRYGGY